MITDSARYMPRGTGCDHRGVGEKAVFGYGTARSGLGDRRPSA